jgi:hypothetical protein
MMITTAGGRLCFRLPIVVSLATAVALFVKWMVKSTGHAWRSQLPHYYFRISSQREPSSSPLGGINAKKANQSQAKPISKQSQGN